MGRSGGVGVPSLPQDGPNGRGAITGSRKKSEEDSCVRDREQGRRKRDSLSPQLPKLSLQKQHFCLSRKIKILYLDHTGECFSSSSSMMTSSSPPPSSGGPARVRPSFRTAVGSSGKTRVEEEGLTLSDDPPSYLSPVGATNREGIGGDGRMEERRGGGGGCITPPWSTAKHESPSPSLPPATDPFPTSDLLFLLFFHSTPLSLFRCTELYSLPSSLSQFPLCPASSFRSCHSFPPFPE